MIVVDAGPLVALFDPRERRHLSSRVTFEGLTDDLVTTVSVLTEASHLLGPASIGFRRLARLVSAGGLSIDYLSASTLSRSFELMEQYADHEMDLADASIVAVAESLGTSRVWTFDQNDFATYRARRGHRLERFEIVS